MKNKKIISITLISLALVTIGLWFNFNNSTKPVPNIEEYIEESNTHFNKLRKDRHTQSLKPVVTESKLVERHIQLMSPSIAPVDFQGFVIDQHGNPVAGATVEYSAGGFAILSGTGSGSIITDSTGMFDLKATGAQGASISIGPIRKIGYEYKDAPEGAPVNASRFDSYKSSDSTQPWAEYSQGNPYQFVMWKKEKLAKIIKGEKRYYFQPDGSFGAVDLESLKVSNRSRHMTGNGHFDAAFTRTDSNWKLELSTPGGGFIEIAENQIYMNIAPDAGYNEKLILNGLNNPRQSRIQKRYYIKTKDGLYGNLLMTIRPYYRENSFLKINYALNLDGTRDLLTSRWEVDN